MCGITGFFNQDVDRKQIILSMNERIIHRGPDAGGYWIDKNSGWVFGHRRLSILDLSENGAQPMISASGRFVICYNGEIYNIESLRRKLIADGYVKNFRGTSDTEVLVEASEAYGIEETISRCRGMFAIALYDLKEKIFTLLRDRAGEKPVYYGFIKDGKHAPFFAFASDPSLFQKIPGFNAEIDRNALAEYMLYKYIPAPMSIYKDIFKLEPGKMLVLKEPFDIPLLKTYWSMKDAAINGRKNQFKGSSIEANECLEKLLVSAIKDQMIADVPLGAFLSGGIDSSLVVSLMQQISAKPIKTFTIGFDDFKYNEAQFAREISSHLGTDHTELYLSEKEMRDVIPMMPYYFTEPFGDSSMLPTYLVSKLARSKVTVALSGDAGDELFCGYDGYWHGDAFWRKEKLIPYALRKPAGRMIELSPFRKTSIAVRMAGCLQSENICQLKDVIFNRKSYFAEHIVLGGKVSSLASIDDYTQGSYSAMQLQDMLSYHPDDILVKVDRAGMAVSLENRIPMLDKNVIEFAWTLPSKYKYDNGVSKKILRDILYKYVPKKMMDRPKQGFSVPLDKWLLEGDTYEWANELLNSNKLSSDGYLDKTNLQYVWKNFKKTKKDVRLVWNILMAEQWYRNLKQV